MKSNNIKDYYKNSIDENQGQDQEVFLQQVGKTYAGKAIDSKMLEVIVDSIRDNLKISKDDILIDLGCANGLITNSIANSAKYVYGFDLSKDLISIAQEHHQKENIKYESRNITEVDFHMLSASKIYMYEVLQHFEYKMLRTLLEELIRTHEKFLFFIGSIPDMKHHLTFYNDLNRQSFFFTEVLENEKFHLGTWWYKEHIISLCNDLGLKVKIIDQDPILHTAYYRYDVLIEKEV